MKTELQSELPIQAAADKVWQILMNFENYGKWNPFITAISGSTTVGSQLKVQLRLPGHKPMNIAPKVSLCEPKRHFAWQGHMFFRGLFDGEHHFELEVLDKNTCRFLHYEKFSGILLPLLWRMLDKDTRAGFEQMNAALKQLAESK